MLALSLLLTFALRLAASQDPVWRQDPDDPLHKLAVLELGPGGTAVQYVAAFKGTLHVWVRSDEVDPGLRIEVARREEVLEDGDSGGGTTAWLALEVVPWQALGIRVLAAKDRSGSAELHLVAAPETDSTRAATNVAKDELETIGRLREEGGLETARRRVAALIEELRGAGGTRSSEHVAEILWELGFVSYELYSPKAAALAWAAVHEHRERVLSPNHPLLLTAKLNLAMTRKQLGDLEDARVLEEHVHAVWERLLPTDHPDLLWAKENLAGTLHLLGDIGGAHALFEALHAARAQLLPADHPDLLQTKQNLAGTTLARGDIEGAHALMKVVHTAFERILPADHPDLLTAKQNLAGTLEALGDFEGAHELLEAVHAARKGLFPADHPDLLMAKGNLAVTRKLGGDLYGAWELEEYVYAMLEPQLPADHPDLLNAKMNLAWTRALVGDLPGGLALAEPVHAARERLLPSDHPDVLRAKGVLAEIVRRMGDLEGALVLQEQAYAAWEMSVPADHPYLLAAGHNLAVTRGQLGDIETAHANLRVVHAAIASALPADHPVLLTVQHNVAVTRALLGDFEGAFSVLESVYEARRRLLPAAHPDLLAAKEGLAGTRYRLWDQGGAVGLLEDVHEARSRLLPIDHPDLLTAKNNLAVMRQELGDLDGARSLLETVHAAWGQRLPADHPSLLKVKLNLASTLKGLGELESARVLEEHVHAVLARFMPADHPDLLWAKENLAATREALGDFAGTLPLRQDIADALPGFLQRAAVAAPREARATSRYAVHWLATARMGSAAGASRLERTSFEVLETARHVAGAPLWSRLASLAGEKIKAIRRNLNQAQEELDRLVAGGPGPAGGSGGHREWSAAVRAAALRRDQAQGDLLALLGRDVIGRITAGKVANCLAPGHLAICISQLPRWSSGPGAESVVYDGQYYLAHVVGPEGGLHEVDLGPVEELQRSIREWRILLGTYAPSGAAFGDRDTGSESTGEADGGRGGVASAGPPVELEVETGRALRAVLLDPLLAAAGDPPAGATLHLALSDALFTLPFEALPLAEDAAAADLPPDDVPRLGDRFRVRYEISMARLIRPAGDPEGPPSVAAVGDVDFDAALAVSLRDARPVPGSVLARAQSADGRSCWGAWSELPATADEVSVLAIQARELLGVEARVLRGSGATQHALAEAVRGVRYVHLATHGWFLPESVKSMLDDEPTAGNRHLLGIWGTVTGFTPLTLCGLVLSGANEARTEAERSARLLTAQELAEFDLTACDLAVLSACETNVGVARAGQGIQSLQTALHRAGARSSITSLWSVPDQETQSLMKHFYDNLWGEGMGKAEALWEAKQALRREGHPPRAWAGWVLAGDPD